MRRALGTTLFGLILLGCPPQLDETEPIEGEPTGTDPVAGDPADGEAANLLGDELQGTPIAVEEEGPWIVRRGAAGTATTALGDPLSGSELESLALMAEPTDGIAEGYGGMESRGTSIGGGGLGAASGREMAAGDAPAGAPTARLERKRDRTPPSPPSTSTPAQAAAPMRAGSTDDNAEFDEYLSFLATWSDDAHVASQWDELDVRDRRVIRVTDRRGKPAPGVHVSLIDEVADRVVWSGTTYGDGSLPYYPTVAAREAGEAAPLPTPKGGYLVQVRHGEEQTLARWDGGGDELALEIGERQQVPDTIPLDVLFLIDTTGSMGDEIARIKATLLRVTERLKELEQEFDLHYAAVLYRDVGDEYVTKAHPFTGDIESFVQTLQGVQAAGGGDGPESLNQGLAHAVSLEGWRDDAARVMFLIADAPPHMDYSGDTPYGQSLIAAVDRGIRVHSVAASGLDSFGTVVMRQTAQFTGGKFIFIEYGSTAASAASHGVTGSVSSNNLDDIIYEQIAGELAGWGRPSSALAAR